METDDELFFGLPLSTHRLREFGQEVDSFFRYEAAIAAISVFFLRSTFSSCSNEPVALRCFFALVLAFLSYTKKNYILISAVEIFSYAAPWLLLAKLPFDSALPGKVVRLLLIASSGFLSMALCHLAATGDPFGFLVMLIPSCVTDLMHVLFPIDEFREAYSIMARFQNPVVLDKQIRHLFFVTFHIQFGIGYLGIEFLKKEQQRRNELVRMDSGSPGNGNSTMNGCAAVSTKMDKASRFQRGAAPFILFVAVPYMIQIIFYGNINKFAFKCLQDDLHRTIRLNELFDHDNHLQAMAVESPISPEAYAASMDTVVETTYDLFNRKLFSLPKVLLLPGVIWKTPQMITQILPFIFVSDWAKGRAITYMTTRVETLQKEIKELSAIRGMIESFDIKNAELLQRSGKGATQFTQKRWEALSVKIQAKTAVSDLITRTKGFFAWIQRNFVFAVLVDCALANLIALGKIASSEIFVFSRAIEDAVDMLLMKSRSEAELARMITEIEKLAELADIWERSNTRSLVHCKPALREEDGITLRHVHYLRGTATVRAEHVEIKPGVYALTGANGSGKSTLFRVLMACDSNDKSIDLPPSITFATPASSLVEQDDIIGDSTCEAPTQEEAPVCDQQRDECSLLDNDECKKPPKDVVGEHVPKLSITMPSSHVVEISQSFYWPLYTKPIDWIYQEHVSESFDQTKLEKRLRLVAEELQALSFFQSQQVLEEEKGEGSRWRNDDGISTVIQHLSEEKEDWFNDLSGGQKSKVELVRKVFLQDHCPSVVLVDETFAPLDPISKALVMTKLKAFCKGSIVIVIYHADIGHGQDAGGGGNECVPSSDFFDYNLHLENQLITIRPVC